MKKRLKGKKLDYEGWAKYMLEMMGQPSKRMLKKLRVDVEKMKRQS